MLFEPLLKVVGDDGSGHQPRPLGEPEGWRLRLGLAEGQPPRDLSLEEVIEGAETAGDAVSEERPIHCVSAGGIAGKGGTARFHGVPFGVVAQWGGLASKLLDAGSEAPGTVEFISRAPGSCGPKGRRHRTTLPLAYCLDPTQGVGLAWRLNGEPLPYPNGGPLRSVVGPSLFFYKGVKWLEEIRYHPVEPASIRGTWETYAGYHNLARVGRNERFEPVLLRIVDVVPGPPEGRGPLEDVLEPVALEQAREMFTEAYHRQDLTRLVGAQLHKLIQPFPMDFSGFTFSNEPFRAKLRGTSFASADFTGARMEGVNFSLSKLTNARFSRGGEDPASLVEGDFEGTYFNKAHLRNVDMRGALLTGATFFAERDFDRPTERVVGLDVREARNLDPRTAEWLQKNGARVS